MWGDNLINDFDGYMRNMSLVVPNSFIIRNSGDGDKYYTWENDGYFKIIDG